MALTRKTWIKIGAIGVVGVFLYLGDVGVKHQVTRSVGSCQSTFDEYYVVPFLGDHMGLPLGSDIRWTRRHNAKADMLRCLCTDKEANQALIRQYHAGNDELWTRVRPEAVAAETGLDPVEQICAEETPYIRLR